MGKRLRRRRKNRRGERAMLKRKREGAEKRDFDWNESEENEMSGKLWLISAEVVG